MFAPACVPMCVFVPLCLYLSMCVRTCVWVCVFLTLFIVYVCPNAFVCLCFSPCVCQMFVMEVKNKGGSKYLIYRRYRQFLTLHQILESKYSSEDPQSYPKTCTLPQLPGQSASGCLWGRGGWCVCVCVCVCLCVSLRELMKHANIWVRPVVWGSVPNTQDSRTLASRISPHPTPLPKGMPS